jgi:hypothetical protein
MKRSIVVVAAMLLTSVLAAGGAWAFGVKDVVQMHRDGIADSLIVQKIQYSGKTFHLDARDLHQLKQAGISDEIISGMLATEDRGRDDYYVHGPYDSYYPYGPYYYPRVFVGLSYYGYYGHLGRFNRPYYGYPYRRVPRICPRLDRLRPPSLKGPARNTSFGSSVPHRRPAGALARSRAAAARPIGIPICRGAAMSLSHPRAYAGDEAPRTSSRRHSMSVPGKLRQLLRARDASLLLVLALTAVFVASARADEPGWPREFDSSSGTFVIYQPQPEDLEGDLLTSRAAFSVLKSGETDPTFGVLWFTERIEIDRDSSTVSARSLDVTKVRLPGITTSDASRYEALIESEATRWDLSGSLAELQAGLAATERDRASVDDLPSTAPRILFVPERAILVEYDGEPVREPIDGSYLERVSNTPYAVIYQPSNRKYYLSGANLWYVANDPLGPWTPLSRVPAAVMDVVPPDTSSGDQLQGPPPRVLTATEPTELIATDGPPQYAPLVEDELLYVTNTESDVVREVETQDLYVLLAGRWFRARSEEGPWEYVRGDQMPSTFGRIPPDSPKGYLLASVAGTDQAEDAIADAEIPQTSAIRRGDGDFEVTYDGPPEFRPIEGTRLQYAINTDSEVLMSSDGLYYACDQGVWYVADHADGPWTVSDTRPDGVDEIPPSCPVYDVRYVYVFDTTPDVIYMGYLPGYVGCYPHYGTVVYGTGYHYAPWRGHHHYYARPCTWGYHARYNPWLSRWSFGFSYGSGFLRVGTNWHSNRFARRHAAPRWFGSGGYRRPLLADDRTPIRTRRPSQRRPALGDHRPANLYNRPENIARVDRGATRKPVRRVTEAKPARVPNDVFAGKDGKVYKRDTGGNWKVNLGRWWKSAYIPPTRPSDPIPPSGEETRAARPMWRPQAQPMDRPQGQPSERPMERPSRPSDSPQVRPAPVTWPTQRRPQEPAAAPSPPNHPAPGDLEHEFRARERARDANSNPPPAPAESPKERPRPDRHR